MAKNKGQAGVTNKAIYSRANYLYQAASYLYGRAEHQKETCQPDDQKNDTASQQRIDQHKALANTARLAVVDMRAVSLKAQIRQTPSLKRTICKFCDSLQIEGRTCESKIENLSRGGRKPWADVLIIKCRICGNVKRYPLNAPRQQRRAARLQISQAEEGQDRRGASSKELR